MTQYDEWKAEQAGPGRLFATIAIVIGSVLAVIALVIVVRSGLQSAGGLGDCGAGCQEKIAEAQSRGDRWWYVLLGSIAMIVGGIAGRITLAKRTART